MSNSHPLAVDGIPKILSEHPRTYVAAFPTSKRKTEFVEWFCSSTAFRRPGAGSHYPSQGQEKPGLTD